LNLSRTKIAVAIPFVKPVSMRWALSLRLLQIPCQHIFIITSQYDIAEARESLVKDALESDCTHILFWDSDLRVEPDALLKLLSHDYPACSAYYWSKKGCAACWIEEDGKFTPVNPGADLPPSFFADFVGFGFCLLDLELFKMLERPWFVYQRELHEEIPPVFTRSEILSEDAYFCLKRLRDELGIRVLVDATFRTWHEEAMDLLQDGRVQFMKAVSKLSEVDERKRKVKGAP